MTGPRALPAVCQPSTKRGEWRQELSIGAWRDFNAYIVARLPYINPSPGAEAILQEQRARADTDWAEKLAAKQREKLRVEGEGLASSARAGKGTAVEDAVSRRLDPMAQKGGVAEAAAAATRAARSLACCRALSMAFHVRTPSSPALKACHDLQTSMGEALSRKSRRHCSACRRLWRISSTFQ